jgi:hypothetical protein
MSYKLLITVHARQRWVERILCPDRYVHLRTCKRPKQCVTCIAQMAEINAMIDRSCREIDRNIIRRYFAAKEAESYVLDPNFHAAIRQRFGDEEFTFLKDHSAVFAISHPPNEPIPVLKTVMSLDMIEGMVFQVFGNDREAIQTVFERWRHERRQGIISKV